MAERTVLQLPPLPTPALDGLVFLNFIVFAAWQWAALSGPAQVDWMEAHFTVSLAGVLDGRVWTVLTSAISQVGVLHLAFNLIALTTFGRDVERLVGSRAFLHLYVTAAVTASVGHLLYAALSGVDVPALGASGAVMGVVVVSALLYPRRWLLLFFVIPLPVTWGVGLFLVVDLLGLVSSSSVQIAHAAHLGGALYGWLYWRYEARDDIHARLIELGVLRRP